MLLSTLAILFILTAIGSGQLGKNVREHYTGVNYGEWSNGYGVMENQRSQEIPSPEYAGFQNNGRIFTLGHGNMQNQGYWGMHNLVNGGATRQERGGMQQRGFDQIRSQANGGAFRQCTQAQGYGRTPKQEYKGMQSQGSWGMKNQGMGRAPGQQPSVQPQGYWGMKYQRIGREPAQQPGMQSQVFRGPWGTYNNFNGQAMQYQGFGQMGNPGNQAPRQDYGGLQPQGYGGIMQHQESWAMHNQGYGAARSGHGGMPYQGFGTVHNQVPGQYYKGYEGVQNQGFGERQSQGNGRSIEQELGWLYIEEIEGSPRQEQAGKKHETKCNCSDEKIGADATELQTGEQAGQGKQGNKEDAPREKELDNNEERNVPKAKGKKKGKAKLEDELGQSGEKDKSYEEQDKGAAISETNASETEALDKERKKEGKAKVDDGPALEGNENRDTEMMTKTSKHQKKAKSAGDTETPAMEEPYSEIAPSSKENVTDNVNFEDQSTIEEAESEETEVDTNAEDETDNEGDSEEITEEEEEDDKVDLEE